MLISVQICVIHALFLKNVGLEAFFEPKKNSIVYFHYIYIEFACGLRNVAYTLYSNNCTKRIQIELNDTSFWYKISREWLIATGFEKFDPHYNMTRHFVGTSNCRDVFHGFASRHNEPTSKILI